MADSIQDSINESTERLLDNIVGGKYDLKDLTLGTKERIVKDKLISDIKHLFQELNKCLDDVQFDWVIDLKDWGLNSQMQKVMWGRTRDEYFSDEDDLDTIYPMQEYDDLFYSTSLQEIDFRINYYWKRKCSLGHYHVKHKFYVCNMPKVIDMIGYQKMGMPIKEIIKLFFKDFFYDPTLEKPAKKKRRLKLSHS